jgi:hypothetical protein
MGHYTRFSSPELRKYARSPYSPALRLKDQVISH